MLVLTSDEQIYVIHVYTEALFIITFSICITYY